MLGHTLAPQGGTLQFKGLSVLLRCRDLGRHPDSCSFIHHQFINLIQASLTRSIHELFIGISLRLQMFLVWPAEVHPGVSGPLACAMGLSTFPCPQLPQPCLPPAQSCRQPPPGALGPASRGCVTLLSPLMDTPWLLPHTPYLHFKSDLHLSVCTHKHTPAGN